MNKLFKLIALAMLLVANASLSATNYNAPTKATKARVAFTDTITGDTYTITKNKESKVYEVFKSKSGARYIWKENKDKTRKIKVYLPKEIQKQMGREYDN